MPKFYLFLSLLALVGCDRNQEFSRLTFDKSVQENRGHAEPDLDDLSPNYRIGLIKLLKESGVDPGAVTMRIDPETDHSVILSVRKGRVDEQTLAGFQDSLERIVQAREHLPLTLSFNLERPAPGNDALSLEAQEEFQDYEVEVSFDGMQLSHAYGVGHAFVDALARRQPEAEAYCSVVLQLSSAVPIDYFDVRTDEPGRGHQFEVSLDSHSGELNADLVFNDQSLQSLVENQDVRISMPVDSGARSDMFMGRLSEVDLEIGSLGMVGHKHGRVAMTTHASLRERCKERAIAIGRPFTFFMGDSLDRLVSVSSIDPE